MVEVPPYFGRNDSEVYGVSYITGRNEVKLPSYLPEGIVEVPIYMWIIRNEVTIYYHKLEGDSVLPYYRIGMEV